MAGDWIKMRCALSSDPKVMAIGRHWSRSERFDDDMTGGALSECYISDNALRHAVTGALHNVWSHVNEHGNDGRVIGATMEWVDSIVGIGKFSSAMESVGWLIQEADGLLFPKFGSHNTCGAERQKKYRERQKEKRDKSDVTSDVTRDNKVTLEKRREEKNREENNTNTGANDSHDDTAEAKPEPYPEDFERLWKVWPRRENKRAAFKAFKTAKKRIGGLELLEAATALAESPKGKGNFCPHLSSWLNADGWADDRAAWQRSGENSNSHSKPSPEIKIVSLPTVNPKHLAEQQRLDREAAEKAKSQQ